MPRPLLAPPPLPALGYRIEANYWGQWKRAANVADLQTKIKERDQLRSGRDLAAVGKRRGDMGCDTPQEKHIAELFPANRGTVEKGARWRWSGWRRSAW